MSSTSESKSRRSENGTITRQTLAGRISQDTDLSARQATEIVDQIIEEITAALANGEEVLISGFGRFVTLDKKSRPGRNPRTKTPLTIEARRVLKFRCSPLLKQELTRALLSRMR